MLESSEFRKLKVVTYSLFLSDEKVKLQSLERVIVFRFVIISDVPDIQHVASFNMLEVSMIRNTECLVIYTDQVV